MRETWTVRIEDGVLEELLQQPMDPLVEAVLFEWCEGLRKRLEETSGHPPDVFPVHTTHPAHLGTVFEERLIQLYYRRRTRSRTWETLWLWPRERREIVITWLFVRDVS